MSRTTNKAQPKYARRVFPDMKILGQDFRMRRERLKLSQTEIAKRASLSSRKYAYFEAGEARLTPDEIKRIDTHLQTREKGDGENIEDNLRFRPLGLLSETEFLDIQRSMLASLEYTDLWLFGLRHLPVLRKADYRKTWENNLRNKSINYRVVWALDEELLDETVQWFQNALSDILEGVRDGGRRLREDTGKVLLYGAAMSAKGSANSALERNKQRFRKVKEHLENHFGQFVKVFPPDDLSQPTPEYERCRPILHFGWLRTVVCYEAKRGANSLAAVLLENISNYPRHASEGESGWTFLTDKLTATLLFHIHAFRDLKRA